MSDTNLTRVNADIISLQRDMSKVDIAIDRLTEISNSVSSLLAVHESKISNHDNLIKTQADTIEKRRIEVEDKISEIHEHILNVEKETQKKLDHQYDEILLELKEIRQESTTQHEEMRSRISAMEKWMWIIVGGAVVVGVLMDKINLAAIF